jgi:hypothetical protein
MSLLRTGVAAIVAAPLFSIVSPAGAEETAVVRPPIVTLELSFPEAGVAMGFRSGYPETALAGGASLLFGLFERFSVGVSVGAILPPPVGECGREPDPPCPPGDTSGLNRLDLEVRYHASLTKRVDAWTGVDLGAAQVVRSASGGGHLGLAGGASYHFVPVLSAGIIARVGLYTGQNSGGTTFAMGASVGIALGLHWPAN